MHVSISEIAQYGSDRYYFLWVYYSSTFVDIKEEKLKYDIPATIFGIGGALGLYLGWSLQSMTLSVFDFLYTNCFKDDSIENNDDTDNDNQNQ